MNIVAFDRASRGRTARAVAAALCVLGLVGIVWLHAEEWRDAPWTIEATPVVAAPPDFLHTPATDPSVPSAQSVLAPQPSDSDTFERPPSF